MGPRSRRVAVAWLVIGAIGAAAWGLGARPLWNLALPSLMCTRQTASGTWNLSSPHSGQYASIQIKANAASETGSKWRPDSFTTDYEITIKPLRSRQAEDVTLAGKDIDALTADAVLDAMRRAGATSTTGDIRVEADHIVEIIEGRLAAVRTGSSGLSQVHERESSFRGSNSSLGSLSTPHLPGIFATLWWIALITGWLVIALVTWRLARRPHRIDAELEVRPDTPPET